MKDRFYSSNVIWQSNEAPFSIFLSGESSGSHCSPSHASVNHGEQIINNALQGTWRQREAVARKDSEAGSSSIEEEVLTVENDSLCSENITSVNEKGIDSKSTHNSLFGGFFCM